MKCLEGASNHQVAFSCDILAFCERNLHVLFPCVTNTVPRSVELVE